MWNDPIVDEVRKAGDEFARENNYDFDKMFAVLKERQKKSKHRIVTKIDIEKRANEQRLKEKAS
ncbi:MAG: hypothetical protein A2096_04755 [Spirochaetes bacterium GWF1_41_5]|nr:MAG: hypothetical protein A2096_04755 [Spirochaetes bacterium GWF1_41_5]